MKRVLLAMLTALLAVGFTANGAEAQKKKAASAKSSGGKKKKAEAVPISPKIAESMGDVKWGVGKDDLIKYFTDKVKEKYRPLVAKAKDAVEDDRLRQQARQEVDAIRKGYVEFDGKSTGWDVSFLKGEFTHGNDEAMLVVRDANSQNFFFLMGGKLWKWYKAFDAAVFKAGNFDTFAGSVQRRFGGGKDVQAEMRPGEGQRHWIEWQDKQTRLRAIDETGFYGFYCLVFEEKSTVDNLAHLRSHGDSSKTGEKRHALVEAVTSDRSANPDDAPNIVDRITGRLHENQQAPQQQGGPEQASAAGKGKAKAAKTASPTPSDSENDPISGLGL
jgi:hypothetical protein